LTKTCIYITESELSTNPCWSTCQKVGWTGTV